MIKHSKSVITQLVMAVKDDELALDFIKEVLDSCGKYIDIINQQEVVITVDKYRLTQEDLLYKIKTLDEHRSMVHNIL